MVIKSPAKINLFLNIISKRKDAYHNIETYFQFVNLYDKIILKPISGSTIKFCTNNKSLSVNNICIKAAELLRSYVSNNAELNVSIELIKNIPIGGGLGGGSSNAASVLLGLNDLWNCNLKKSELIELGAKLGSDVPVFINGFSAYGEGTGTSLTAYRLEKKYFLIVNPKIHVSSKKMYGKYKIKDCIKHINLDNMHDYIGFNSFESLLCDEYPEIKDILDILRTNSNCSVSGSGGCLFSIFDEEIEAKNARELLPKKYQTYIVHSLNNI